MVINTRHFNKIKDRRSLLRLRCGGATDFLLICVDFLLLPLTFWHVTMTTLKTVLYSHNLFSHLSCVAAAKCIIDEMCVCVCRQRHERIVWPFGDFTSTSEKTTTTTSKEPRRRRRRKRFFLFWLAFNHSLPSFYPPCCECDWTRARSPPSRRYGYIGSERPASGSVIRFHRAFRKPLASSTDGRKKRRVQRRRFCPGLKLTRDPSVSFFLSCRGLCRSLSVESRRRTLNELRCDSIIFPDTHTHVRRRASATAIELADFSFQRSKEDESQDQKTRWRSLSFLFSLIPSSRSIRSCEGDWRAVGQKYFSIPKGKSRPSSLFLFSSSFGFWLRLSALLLSRMERERGFDCASSSSTTVPSVA